MTTRAGDPQGIDNNQIVEHIYDIALEPSLLEDFIDLWADSGFASHFAETTGATGGDFDAIFKEHLERAETFLQRGISSNSSLADHLKPFERFAAFIVNTSGIIEATNLGAVSALGAREGDSLTVLDIPNSAHAALLELIDEVARSADGPERLLKVNTHDKQGTALFRILRVPDHSTASAAALVVSTQFHWHDSIAHALSRAFKLTEAEQNVVRLLVEGHSAGSIASERGTSVGTVRNQIKSIIRKMNLRSQSDIVRLVVSMAVFSHETENKDVAKVSTSSVKHSDWLDVEVWKPFKNIKLPNGRTLTYHDMGPPSGNPVLFSHMGSCMVRWSRSMIGLAFLNNLRVICPIRAGYAQSDPLESGADVFEATSNDVVFLLNHLGIERLPYAVYGSDFPLAVDLISKYPDKVTALIGVGGRPCLPGGMQIEGAGRWQQFFLWRQRLKVVQCKQ